MMMWIVEVVEILTISFLLLLLFLLVHIFTVFLPEKEAPSKELSMSIQVGWVKN